MSPEVLLALVLLAVWGVLLWRTRSALSLPPTPTPPSTAAPSVDPTPTPRRCEPRPADGPTDRVRAIVFAEVVRHPNHLGVQVFHDGEGRAPWRPTTVGCGCRRAACLARRPLGLVVTWGWS